jgi:vancomycin aglycone glucosyltransferase
MRVVIAVEGTRGDTHPMLALAEVLEAAGHRVRLCAPEDAGPEITRRGFEFCSLGENVRTFLTEHAAALHSRGPRFVREMGAWAERSIDAQFRVLPEATADADFVLAAGTVIAAASAAELRGIPYRFVAYTSALLPSVEHSPALLPFQTNRPVVNRVLWWLTRRFAQVAMGGQVNRRRSELGLPPVRNLFNHLLSQHPILAVDDLLSPAPRDTLPAVDHMRCFHPHDLEPLPAKLESFLDSGPAPIYLGFGSMTDPNPALTTDCMLDALDALGHRAVISKGWAGLGERSLPDGVIAIGPVSHASLFGRCRAIVHHGGSGTTHTAARSGVPQVLVPHVLDQFYFERRVQALGIGPPGIPRAKLTTQRLVETLRAVLDNELLEERARELGEQLALLGPIAPDPDRVLTA